MSIYEDLQPISLDQVRTYPLASRSSKVTVADFATPIMEESSLRDYLNSLPNILAVQNLRELPTRIRRARSLGKPIVWGIRGPALIRVPAPIIIHFVHLDVPTAHAANAAPVVPAAEITAAGFTVEDV